MMLDPHQPIELTFTNTSPTCAISIECSFCRRPVPIANPYHTLLLGLEDMPQHAGVEASLVESVSELIACERCIQPVAEKLNAFLQELWALRAPDASPEAPEKEK